MISGHRDPRMLFCYTHPKPEEVAAKLGTSLNDECGDFTAFTQRSAVRLSAVVDRGKRQRDDLRGKLKQGAQPSLGPSLCCILDTHD